MEYIGVYIQTYKPKMLDSGEVDYDEYADILALLNDPENLTSLIDISEENMKNLAALYSPYGWDWTTNDGGNDRLAIGYLASWLGPVYDSDDRYTGTSVLSPVLSSIMHVQNVFYLNRNNYTDNDNRNNNKNIILFCGIIILYCILYVILTRQDAYVDSLVVFLVESAECVPCGFYSRKRSLLRAVCRRDISSCEHIERESVRSEISLFPEDRE